MTRALLFVLACLAACANPVPPTGGPPDQTPPFLRETVPDTGAVHVESGVLRLTFSEAIDPRSLAQALTVTPEGERPPEVTARGRTATIDLGELRARTTYVVTFDNALRDARGVALKAPIVLAFSTGPTLDRGTLAGEVISPETGAGVSGVDVYAYAAADTAGALPERPLYRTQTGVGGSFTFSYLGGGPFYVVAVQDANRNRRLDAGEASAAPPRPALSPDSAAADTPWLLNRADTTAPRVERVRSYSATRHALRLAEGVASVEGDWQVTDTMGGSVPILARYRSARVPQEVFFTTPPVARQRLVLGYEGVADSAGNVLKSGSEQWTAASARDTFRLAFAGFLPADGVLRPGEPGAVRFTLPLPDSLSHALVFARQPDSTETPLALESTDGTTYTFDVMDSLTVVVRADTLDADSTPEVLTFRAATGRDVGEIEGVVAAADATRVVVEAWQNGARIATVRPDTSGAFRLEELLPGAYTLRAFDDADGDGRWNGGSIAPYRPAERIRWVRDPIDVRARWTNNLPDTLSFFAPPATLPVLSDPLDAGLPTDTLRAPRP